MEWSTAEEVTPPQQVTFEVDTMTISGEDDSDVESRVDVPQAADLTLTQIMGVHYASASTLTQQRVAGDRGVESNQEHGTFLQADQLGGHPRAS